MSRLLLTYIVNLNIIFACIIWMSLFFLLSDAKYKLYPLNRNYTSSSAIGEGPCDALSQLKSCQLLHNCTKNHI